MTLDTDPREVVQSILVIRNAELVYLMMYGYDDDPRELYEIEEMCAYCKRLIDSGLYGAIAFHMRSSSKLKFDFSIFFPAKCANNLGKAHKGKKMRDFDFEPSIRALLADGTHEEHFKTCIRDTKSAAGLLWIAYKSVVKLMGAYPLLNAEANDLFNRKLAVFTDIGDKIDAGYIQKWVWREEDKPPLLLPP